MTLSTKSLCKAAIVAALYTALTLLFQPICYGAVQFRVSEALTLLPVLMPEAVPGLALGCFLSNLLNPAGAVIWDVIFGTLATLAAAIITRRMKGSLWLRTLPPILINAVVVGLVITYGYGVPTPFLNMLTVGLGEAGVCIVLGIPMILGLRKNPLFQDQQPN